MLGKILKINFPKAKVILTALQPPKNLWLLKLLIPFLKSDLIIVQSQAEKRLFKARSCKTEFLASGVDLLKFKPASQEEKYALRRKYSISLDKFIILHVGHINKGRNLSGLIQLQSQDDVQVLVVSSPVFKPDKQFLHLLRRSGCILFNEFIDKIEELYQLADAYVFPTESSSSSITIPLSVLEAMACNLMIITTKFRALDELFKEGDGLFFVDRALDIPEVFKELKKAKIDVSTREKVLAYSWENVASALENIYEKT